MSYFEDTNAFILGNGDLRHTQRKAYKALKNAFNENIDEHKIIVLATGAGKTGVMAIAPYGISKGRVLIITPSLVIREGISDEFDTRTNYNFWTKRKVILDDNELPKVYRYAGFKTPSDKKRVKSILEESNIVIANIHKVYSSTSNKSLVSLIPKDFFDMIIIDEAHHSAADSWIGALDYFTAKKIVKLTATPYRADEKELGGKIIYRYDLANAIKDGVVKNIVSEDYTTQKLEFEIDGKIVSKDEALEKMDRNWVSRSVAYSYECSKKIVEMSVERLIEKRRMGKAHHQIVAVACSVNHAEQIMRIYSEYGLKSQYVSCDRPEESEKAIIEFKKGQIDVLVNVNMLSEGFDHPNISIAAIFRPFKALSPYAQFIGRALRKIEGDNINNEIDNVAHVIYHKELDLDDLWNYYTGQRELAKTKKLIQVEFDRQENETRERNVGAVIQEGELIGNINTFLDDNIDEIYHQSISNEIIRREQELKEIERKMRSSGLDESTIEEVKKAKQREYNKEIDKKREQLREELIREELSIQIKDDIIDRVAELCEITGINPQGNELPDNTKNKFLKSTKTNEGYMIKYINNILKRKLKRSKDEWEIYDFELAQDMLPEIIKALKEKIERVK